jgi:hypothetical protein
MRNISRRARDKTKIGCPARALDHRPTSGLRLPDPNVTRKLPAQLPGQIVRTKTAAAGSSIGIISKSPRPAVRARKRSSSACKAACPLVKRDAGPVGMRETALRRRQFLLAGLASALVAPAAAQERRPTRSWPRTRQGNGRALVSSDGARHFDLLHGGRGHQGSRGHRSGAPRGSALHLGAERPQSRGHVQRGAEIKRGASADRAEQGRHQRRRQGDRRVVDRRRSPPVRASVVHAFARSSTLLVARAAENQSWWCCVYAFGKVRC